MAKSQDPIKHREAQRRYREANRDKIKEHNRSAANREQRRLRRAKDPEKEAQLRRKYRLRRLAKVKIYSKAYRLAHREEIAAYNKKYSTEHHDEALTYQRTCRAANYDRVLVWQRRSEAKAKSINAIRHNPEDVYRVVSRAVSSALPRFMRDDVINSMLLAVLEGKLLLEHVGARMKEYVTGYNREYDTFKTLSLDAPWAALTYAGSTCSRRQRHMSLKRTRRKTPIS
ncbi:hypothetical protein DBIPINDM_008210 (plasmid) [Mesorhizobium sp. AR02]|uniref:hypothetical protein n=1 Tax=Mesorhizobium sp. AR02 TaxID=2865837 RepID=UPI00215F12DE|nr:hypothetical protein [Mesorhizobium sp. AR02]UVK57598.1 hypothetical protein DBIPINDM_008210 [Mesorhizobium sp. AR02]